LSDTGWAGVFGMATLPTARGATRLYLQVECDNMAARRLYERAGFTELCRYRYRTAPLPGHG
jgi:ribosomal protein S18 acetylase RimI-like enzyme